MSYDTNDKVIFDYVITNVGNAYDNVAGIFTVPYNESYELTLTTIGTGKTVTDITAPGGRLCQAYAKESNVIGEFKSFPTVLFLNIFNITKQESIPLGCLAPLANRSCFAGHQMSVLLGCFQVNKFEQSPMMSTRCH